MSYKEPKALPVSRKGISKVVVDLPTGFRIDDEINYVGLIGRSLFLYKEKPAYNYCSGIFECAEDELTVELSFTKFFEELGSFRKTDEILFKIRG